MRLATATPFVLVACSSVSSQALPGAPEVMQALEACKGKPVVYDATCKQTDDPTEYSCTYRLRDGLDEGVSQETVIAKDGDHFVLIDIPRHCQTL